MSIPLRRRVAVVVWSILVWCALWSDLSVANVLWGAVVGVVTQAVVPLHTPRSSLGVSPLGVLRFLAFALWALVKSSAVVAWEVITPGNRTNMGIVAIPLRTDSVALATLIANTVSLTPGTLTLEIGHDPLVLYVHVMHLRSIEDARREVAVLEDHVLRAFPARTGAPRRATEETT